MKLVHISDTHGVHADLEMPEGDVLIHSGDWSNFPFNGQDFRQYQEWRSGQKGSVAWKDGLTKYEKETNGMRDETREFLKWMDKQPYKHKILVAGNHDGYAAAFETKFKDLVKDTSITYLQNSGVEIDGLKFWGSPFVPEFCGWWFMKERGIAMKNLWDKIPVDTNILVTHGPAYDACDYVDELNPNVGCEDLAKRISDLKELVCHLFGHIHPSRGLDLSHSTKGGPLSVNGCSVHPVDGIQSPIIIPLAPIV